MKKSKVDVKSKGAVLGQVEVTVYESIEEAINIGGKDAVLAAYNKEVSAKVTNGFRSDHVREKSPIAQLGKLAKTDPKIAAEIEAILARRRG